MLEKPAIGAPCNGCGLCCQAEVCSAGSFTMGLVAQYGERAPGPCPALVEQDDGALACGMVLRPKDYSPGKGSAHDLRAAIMIMIGGGAGCDEAGPEPESDAADKIAQLQRRYMEMNSSKIEPAVRKWFGV